MKKEHFREEVSANLQEIVQDKHLKAIKYEKLLALYKKLNGVLGIFDQWERDLLAKERALVDLRYGAEKPNRELDTLSKFIGKMENIENISKRTLMDILDQKKEIKEHERILKQRESMLNQKEAELTALRDKSQHQEKSFLKGSATKTQQPNEVSKGEVDKIKAELESKATKLMKQETMLSQKEQDLEDKEKQLNQREQTIVAREGSIESKAEILELKDKGLTDRESELKQNEVLFGELEALIRDKELKLKEKEHIIDFKEQTIKEKENQIAEKEAELAANSKNSEERFELLKKGLETKEQTFLKLTEAAIEEKLQAQTLTQTNLDQLKQKDAEILKRDKELAKLKEESRKRRESTLAFDQKIKKGVDPEMLEAYRKEVEKAFLYTKTDIKRVTSEYSKKGTLESPTNSVIQESQGHDRERHKLAFAWFKIQLDDKIAQFEQFLTGRMIELQSFLDPDSISKSSITKDQFMLQILEPKSDERLELEELRRTLKEQEKELLKKEEFYKRRETDVLNKAWKIKNMVRKLNVNLKENTIKNMHEAQIQNSSDVRLEGDTPSTSENKKTIEEDQGKIIDNAKFLPVPTVNTQGGFSDYLPKE